MRIKLDEYGILPTRAHPTDAGLDLYSPYRVTVPAHGSAVVRTGVHVELPRYTVGMLKSKSGLNVRQNIVSEGVIDEGYSGEIVVKLHNLGSTDYEIESMDKITQLVVMPVLYVPVERVEEIRSGDRAEGGFGSTGR